MRPVLQDIVQKGIAKNRAVLPPTSAEGVECIAKDLARDVLTAGSNTPGEKSMMLWMTDSSAEVVRKWLAANGSVNALDHPAFCAARNKLLGRLCKCRKDPSTCPVHAEASVTLADVSWWAADAIFEHMPCAVPTFPLALAVKVSGASPAALSISAENGGLPSFCHFLCKELELPDEQNTTTVMVPNNAALEVLVRMRPVYLLKMLETTMQSLARGHGKEPGKFADFSPPKLLRVSQALLQLLGDGNDASEATDDEQKPMPAAVQLETLMITMVADESDWATAWLKFLSKCMSSVTDVCTDDAALRDNLSTMCIKDLGLDVPSKFRYLLSDSRRQDQVKAEAASPAGKKLASVGIASLTRPAPASVTKNDANDGNGSLEEQVLASVYTYHTTPEIKWNVLDVLSLQLQITSHLFAQACLSRIELTNDANAHVCCRGHGHMYMRAHLFTN